MKSVMLRSIYFLTVLAFTASLSYAQSASSQNAGSVQQQEEQLRKEQELEKQITTPKKKAPTAPENEATPLPENGQKTFIKHIDVQGATLVPQAAIDNITKDYEDKDLTIRDMQKVCDLITDLFRQKGYVTSRAYMPPQTISKEAGILVIIIVQGKVGTITVHGNKYFSAAVYKRRLEMKPGEYFDYNQLQRDLVLVNDHPDRFVKSGLVPGQVPGTTDIVLEVQDRLPLHWSLANDNFGNRYMDSIRNTVGVEDNNLTGHDDKASFQYQHSLGDYYSSPYVSYTYPVNNRLDGGVYWVWADTKLAKELKPLDIKGKSSIGGPFVNYTVVDTNAFNFKLTGGFDYKKAYNYVNGGVLSRDQDRVLKGGFEADLTDPLGRTVLTAEEDVGVMAGGLYEQDPLATTLGAGAKFQKVTGYLYRLQPMPFNSDILWKNNFQYSNYNLLSLEQFQLGGISNLRGFSPGFYSADSGVTSSFDWSFPLYGLSKTAIVPWSKSTWYDASRFVIFYDAGYAREHDPLENLGVPHTTLQDIGYGFRLNLLENFSARLEIAYPLAPGDDESGHLHMYWDLEKKF